MSMRWEDERYVKVYTRDTPEWCVLSWEARSIFVLLLRTVDRAGVMPLGRAGLRGVAAALRAPPDVVERAVEELAQDGCVVVGDGELVIPNYVEAQNTRASDKARQQASRERARDDAKSRAVTTCHTPSHDVTPSSAQPSPDKNHASHGAPAVAAPPPVLELKPQEPEPEAPAPKPKPVRKPSAQETLWGRMQVMRAEACPGAPPDPGLRPAALNAKLGELLDAGHFGGEGPLLEAYGAFLADERWARNLDPPCPLSAFVSQWAKYASAAQRYQHRAATAEASAARSPPAEPCIMGCGRPAPPSSHEGYPICLRCLGGWLQIRTDARAPISGDEAKADLGRWIESQRRPAPDVAKRQVRECEACGGRAEATIAGGEHPSCYGCMAAWGETLARERPNAKPFSPEAEEHFTQWAAQKRGRAA
jgi:hypothetical protein